jgi:hypothetical protein
MDAIAHPSARSKPLPGKREPDLPPSRRRPALATLGDVRRELAWLYRQGLNGGMAWSDCTKAGHLLGMLARIIEGSDLERRLEALEGASVPPYQRPNGHADHPLA